MGTGLKEFYILTRATDVYLLLLHYETNFRAAKHCRQLRSWPSPARQTRWRSRACWGRCPSTTWTPSPTSTRSPSWARPKACSGSDSEVKRVLRCVQLLVELVGRGLEQEVAGSNPTRCWAFFFFYLFLLSFTSRESLIRSLKEVHLLLYVVKEKTGSINLDRVKKPFGQIGDWSKEREL